MTKAIEVQGSGLVCDNESCSFEKRDVPLQDYGAWVGAQCPDCGEVLLTQAQYNLVQGMLDIVNGLNELAEDPFVAALVSKIDNDMEGRKASVRFRCTKDAELEVGEIEWKDN